MTEFTIKEYSESEHRADLQALIAEKGLKGAVQKFCDLINEDASGLPYIPHVSIQEWLCEILILIDIAEGKKMTNEEAIRRIKDHMVIHKMDEPRCERIKEKDGEDKED